MTAITFIVFIVLFLQEPKLGLGSIPPYSRFRFISYAHFPVARSSDTYRDKSDSEARRYDHGADDEEGQRMRHDLHNPEAFEDEFH
jgi:hypothetical protein